MIIGKGVSWFENDFVNVFGKFNDWEDNVIVGCNGFGCVSLICFFV